jgi:hypothetical protein
MKFDKRAWMGSIVFRSDRSHLTNEIALAYYPYDLVNGIPRVGIGRYRDGGTLPADRWLRDKWASDVLDEGRAQWFLGYLDRMAKGEAVPMWEIAREYENRHGAPMQVLLPPLPTGLSFESYCCRQHHFGAEAPSSAMVQFPVSTPIRDGCWRALLDCRVGAGQRTESDYCIAYYESSYRGEPGLLVQRGKRGALYAARRASEDKWCRGQLESGPAEWFLPYLTRFARGEKIPIWELHREQEERFGHPAYLLPPGIPLDDAYCEWYFKPAEA